MKTCKTCKHWKKPENEDVRADQLCNAYDPDTYKPMERGFECRVCYMPTQTFAEAPIERNGFGMTDASEYYAVLVTADDFGCVGHEEKTEIGALSYQGNVI